MIKLLKGDSSTHLVDINLPDAAFESGAVLEFMCGDMCRAFPAMPRIELRFDAEWTAAQSPGRMLAHWTLVSPEGDRATLTNTYPIYITIDAAEVGTAGSVSAPVVPSVDLSDLEALDPAATPGETKELVNEILRRLRSACIALAIGVPALVSVAATVHKSPLDEVHGTDGVVTDVSFEGLATTAEIGEVTGYARAVYNYMLGNTNAWFSGTNYPDKATAPNKHKFEFEPGMDLMSVPCSMALWEIRDGERGTVWDQRDWVSWYWNFKSRQMWDQISATNKAIIASIPRKAWGSYTASGLDNPDPSTVWVDRENTTLAAGMAWQNAIVANGCGYWTIVGNGITLAPDEKRTSLDIRDFDGKSVMRIIKGESYLAPVTREDFLAQGVDAAGRITFTIRSNVKPVGEYSTVPDTASFVTEDSENCPADWEWEQVDGGWKIHFLLKSGIDSNACFARFKVSVEGQSTIEYTTAPTISSGLIYNGVKIAPVISGDTVTWKVVK